MALKSALINAMGNAARKAQRSLIRDFNEVEHLQVSKKGPADFVSAADRKAEKILQGELAKLRPDFGFLMEEGGRVEARDGRHYWIIDPLDGTTNFLHGIPHFAISVAVQREGELIAGIVLDVIRDELFWAEKGVGAYLNERRIRVSARRKLSEALFATGIPFLGRPGHAEFRRELAAVMGEVAGIRRMGSAALDLAYVAAGRYDGYWETGLSPWDVAAGIVLVREAGGMVTDYAGGDRMVETSGIVAANDVLHAPLRKLLVQVG
ncbi:MAG TPA: inositol monophosphatase family protein [Ferrovibrio sp.]|jgi:myo-inositol-1(or 4)-monophosphatase|uniref:inositol monophosphatase family protein n=1 Tax=Ferrovibrio sp. TaxID=1917215 RepID=UPI002B4B6FBF|nr:inositol monophosphatase family protein [Ferrovibrio sp.]HLT79004.1 inositol monophosphatase family protein [Ferrovibrio sp.]